jgi:hypothetical protein
LCGIEISKRIFMFCGTVSRSKRGAGIIELCTVRAFLNIKMRSISFRSGFSFESNIFTGQHAGNLEACDGQWRCRRSIELVGRGALVALLCMTNSG